MTATITLSVSDLVQIEYLLGALSRRLEFEADRLAGCGLPLNADHDRKDAARAMELAVRVRDAVDCGSFL